MDGYLTGCQALRSTYGMSRPSVVCLSSGTFVALLRELTQLLFVNINWPCITITFCYLFHGLCKTGFFRAMLCISAAYAVMRCPSVCLSVHLSVTFVISVKTNKRIFEFFLPLGSQPF